MMRQTVALMQRDRKIPISALMQSTAASADHCGKCEWAFRGDKVRGPAIRLETKDGIPSWVVVYYLGIGKIDNLRRKEFYLEREGMFLGASFGNSMTEWCNPSYTDKILSRSSLAVRFAKIFCQCNLKNIIVSFTDQRLIRSSNGD